MDNGHELSHREIILCEMFKMLEADALTLLNSRPLCDNNQRRAAALIDAQDVVLDLLRNPIE